MGLPSSYKTETRKFRRGLGPAIEWLANAIVSSAANIYYVSTNGNDANSGESWDEAFLTVQAAHDAASEGDLILVAPGEYDEDIEITTGKISIVGAGPRHSIRITGTSAGTKTAMTLTGVQDVGLYNLNLEGRTSSGSALVYTGQIRRVEVAGCKIHGGDQAVLISAPASSQTVDVRFEDCVIANSAIGISINYSGGDPCHQIVVTKCLFSKITADCIVENGATHDISIYDNVFAASDGTEPTQFLDIDTTGTTGFVAKNVFHTTIFSTAKFAIATGVLFAGNISEAENPSTNVGGTSGRPDA
jgi:hypothetical protein